MSGAPDGRDESAADPPEFDEGRYLYCIVRAGEDDSFAVGGIEDGETSLVVAEGVGGTEADGGTGIAAVVQPVSAPFDSSSPKEIQRWLLRHQGVVDDAGERFGTPLPFRFDTIMRGDDEGVRAWIREERETLEAA
ncbi:GvpL/GvpF family gas vesicle protein, partial [Halobium palmae]